MKNLSNFIMGREA